MFSFALLASFCLRLAARRSLDHKTVDFDFDNTPVADEIHALRAQVDAAISRTLKHRARKCQELLPQTEAALKAARLAYDKARHRFEKERAAYHDNYNIVKRKVLKIKDAKTYSAEHVKPWREQQDNAMQIIEKGVKLHDLAKDCSQPFDVKTFSKGGVCGVYNPATRSIEWKAKLNHGVGGVYNPTTQSIEWKEEYDTGVAGVWNPRSKQVEWKENWRGGVAGVWNPILSRAEWQEKEWLDQQLPQKTRERLANLDYGKNWNTGVAGVWNPLKNVVEWKENHFGGIAGYFDSKLGRVNWFQKDLHGVAIVAYDDQTGYVSSCGFHGETPQGDFRKYVKPTPDTTQL